MPISEENISEKKRKIFVLDTSVIIDDSKCLDKLGENDVVIPIMVLEELDNIKKELDDNDPEKRKYRTPEVRFAAREFLRVIVNHKIGAEFDDAKPFSNGVRVKIDSIPIIWTAKLKRKLQAKKNDNDIILTALRLSELKENNMGKREVVLITQDINMQAKAQALGIIAEGFYSNEVKIEEEYNGKRIVQLGDILKEESSDEVKGLFEKNFTENKKAERFFANETIVVPFDGGKYLYAVVKQKEEKDDSLQSLSWVDLEKQMNQSYCSPKNIEQAIAFNYLMDPSIEILTITGKAGTGKTLLSLMAAWQQLHSLYDTIYVYRPYVEVGNSIGFLPGDLSEKMAPFKKPIYDNLKVLFENPWTNKSVKSQLKTKKNWKEMSEMERENFIIELEKQLLFSIFPLNHTRGINLHRTFVILDETQNTTSHEVKTLVTRLGVGSKIVLVGDLSQIDSPYLSERSNGLAHVIGKFKGKSMYAHVHLKKNERSSLSNIAAEIL